jgi:hypothetical protein
MFACIVFHICSFQKVYLGLYYAPVIWNFFFPLTVQQAVLKYMMTLRQSMSASSLRR